MKKTLVRRGAMFLALLAILVLVLPSVAQAAGKVHVVKRGDTLYSIARRYGTSVSAIAKANGIGNPNYIYVGQRLVISGKGGGGSSSGGKSGGSSVHVVKRGETLYSIARRYGTSVSVLVRINGLRNANLIYTGQRLKVSGKGSGGKTGGGTTPPPKSGKKWIEVDLSSQRVFAHQGNAVVRRMVVSTGLARYPTPTGRFRIYAKYRSTTMSGPGYHLPGVPHAMFFYKGYSLHGTYWHHNFGHRMSHGCINLKRADAAWLYSWAPYGTEVRIHH